MQVQFQLTGLSDFKKNIYREWALTNGIGGYAGSSIIGAHNRTHQGYLIASLHPPVERYLLFSKTNEKIACGSRIYELATAQHKGPFASEYAVGNMHLKSFTYDGTATFKYECGDLRLTKTIAMAYGENKTAIYYVVENNGGDSKLTITPLINYREHSASQTVEGLKEELPLENFDEISGLAEKAVGFQFSPNSNKKLKVGIACSTGKLVASRQQYDVNMELQTEVDNEVDGLDCHFKPFEFVIDVPAGGLVTASLVCEAKQDKKSSSKFSSDILQIQADTADAIIEKAKARFEDLYKQAEFGDDEFANSLVLAADQFIAKRQSTGYSTVLAGLPWFTDWGRDTMISFTGLTLETKRFDEARDILKTFAMYIKDGLVPNMFPDNGLAPLYNTVDASLWYFNATYNYLKYVDTDQAWEFVEKEIYPGLQEIMGAYRKGTKFAIYMDEDGLLHAGDGLDQVTWMDVRVDDWVATPRHGKPVEINALWYNALMIMDEISRGLAKRNSEKGADYLAYAASAAELAKWVKDSFVKEFWNEAGDYLYDVVDGEIKDATIRPNQIYAISLPFSMLNHEQSKLVLETVERKLYVGVGLRSLDPDDPLYHGVYLGSLNKRDHAYHQGTAWGFLLGAYITAFVKVNGLSEETKEKALALFEPVKTHMAEENCIGSICEIFDGDAPHNGRGCYAQAWSVGEILRAYAEIVR